MAVHDDVLSYEPVSVRSALCHHPDLPGSCRFPQVLKRPWRHCIVRAMYTINGMEYDIGIYRVHDHWHKEIENDDGSDTQ